LRSALRQQPLTEIERRSVRYRTDVMNDGF